MVQSSEFRLPGYGAAASLCTQGRSTRRLPRLSTLIRHGVVPTRQSTPGLWRPAAAGAYGDGPSPAKLSAGWEPPSGWSLTNLNSLTSSQRLGSQQSQLPGSARSLRSVDLNSLTSSLSNKSMGSMGARAIRRPGLDLGPLPAGLCSYIIDSRPSHSPRRAYHPPHTLYPRL